LRRLQLCRSIDQALARAYEGAARIDWPAKAMRSDIGRRVLGMGAGLS
jgi:phosphoribosylamine-glycine ligase